MLKNKHLHIGFSTTIVIVLLIIIGIMPLTAQDNASEITLSGPIESLTINSVVISGLTVNFSEMTIENDLAAALTVGTPVTVTGRLENGVVIASSITLISDDTATEEPPQATEEPTDTATEEPPQATEEPTEAPPTAAPPITVLASNAPIIVIEGPVQSINVNIITIYDIDIQVASNDPILTQIDIDDIISVEGEAVDQGGIIIVNAVNVTLVQAFVFVVDWQPGFAIPPGCKTTKNGKIKCTGRVNPGFAVPAGCKVTKKGKIKCT